MSGITGVNGAYFRGLEQKNEQPEELASNVISTSTFSIGLESELTSVPISTYDFNSEEDRLEEIEATTGELRQPGADAPH